MEKEKILGKDTGEKTIEMELKGKVDAEVQKIRERALRQFRDKINEDYSKELEYLLKMYHYLPPEERNKVFATIANMPPSEKFSFSKREEILRELNQLSKEARLLTLAEIGVFGKINKKEREKMSEELKEKTKTILKNIDKIREEKEKINNLPEDQREVKKIELEEKHKWIELRLLEVTRSLRILEKAATIREGEIIEE